MDAADFASVYGLPPALTFDQFFALWLNLERVRARASFDLSRAVWVAGGQETLPDQWIESVTETDGEAGRWRVWSLRRELDRN